MFVHRRLPPPLPLLVPFLILTAALQTFALQHALAQEALRPPPLSPIVPSHYLVAYRNSSIPSDAAVHTSLAGARVLQRHERFGVAVVQANGTADDATNLTRLASQPDVDFVMHDRMVDGQQTTTATAGYHNPIARPPDAGYDAGQRSSASCSCCPCRSCWSSEYTAGGHAANTACGQPV